MAIIIKNVPKCSLADNYTITNKPSQEVGKEIVYAHST